MFKSKKLKTLLIAIPLSLLLAHPAYAASYTVAPGDSLYTIGKLFNTGPGTIMMNNKLSDNTIYPGQVLDVHASTYTVKSGDSLFLIAQKYDVSLGALRVANGKWDDSINPGQTLLLPASASGSVQGSVNSTSSSISSTTSGSAISYTASDLDLLARLITAEADGEPYNAMVGVGAVVVNRTKDPSFSNSISGVINEVDNGYYQFTPVKNGWINNPATQEAKNAAYDALHGNDPTNGALFYFDDSSTNQWLWSKPIATIIDKMVYTYS